MDDLNEKLKVELKQILAEKITQDKGKVYLETEINELQSKNR